MSHAGWRYKVGSLIRLCLWPEQNNKLKLWKTKLYLIIRQIQDMEKLYFDKKGVSKSYANSKKSNTKTKATLGKFYGYL